MWYNQNMEVKKASIYGFCEGVKYALNYVAKVKNEIDGDIFLLGNLLHNKNIMDELQKNGIKVLTKSTLEDRINSIEKGTVIFSAHGHDPKLEKLCEKKGLNFKDATCPRVIKNMQEINKAIKNKEEVFYIGIKNHEESNAALSLNKNIHFIDYQNPIIEDVNKNKVHVFNQTTLSHLALEDIYQKIQKKYPQAILHNDICHATYLRQKALDEIKEDIFYVIVLGDETSSNTKRLKEIAETKYKDKIVLLFSTLDEVKKYKFDCSKKIFLTAGASTPDSIINPIAEYLKNLN